MKTHRTLTLRPFARISLTLLLFVVCLHLAACSTAWTSEASSIIAMLDPAIIAALGILTAFGVGLSPSVLTQVQNWSSQAQTALAEVRALIDSYNTAEAGQQPGILQEIQTGLSTIASGLTDILGILHVSNPQTQAKISAIFQAVAEELSALIALVPALQGKVGMKEAKRLAANVKTAEEFKEYFNQMVAQFGDVAKSYQLK